MADWLAPLLMTVATAAFWGGTDVFAAFTDGAERGLKVVLGMAKALVPLLAILGMARAAGLFDLLAAALTPLTAKLDIPAEVVPVLLLRPFSGSAAMAAAEDVVRTAGVDSLAGRIAVTALAAGETTLYVMGLYLPGGPKRRAAGVLAAALFGDLLVGAAAILWNMIFF